MSFEKAVATTLAFEGGYANDLNDPGGETHWGISKRSYPHLDIKSLTVDEAKDIYLRDFWNALGCDDMPPALAAVAFDIAVNSGVTRAREWLASTDDPTELTLIRLEFYGSLKNFYLYGRGWTRRAVGVLREALHSEGDSDA